MTTDMPEVIYALNGADDPACEFTAMRTKEYDLCVKYIRSDKHEELKAIAEKMADCIRVAYVTTGEEIYKQMLTEYNKYKGE